MPLAFTLRALRLVIGLSLYGVGCAVMIAAGVGLDPWMVLSQGVATQTGVGIGWVTNIIGLAVLLIWIPLRQKPGPGTILNIAIVGTAIQLTLPLLATPDAFVLRLVMFMAGTVLVGLATGLYLGTDWGPGPRDGLMTGLSRRVGVPLWVARTAVEVTVLIAGWLLGGTVGLGTIIFALAIGPLCQFFVELLGRSTREPKPASVLDEARPGAAGPHPRVESALRDVH